MSQLGVWSRIVCLIWNKQQREIIGRKIGEFEFGRCSFAFSFVELEFVRDEGVHGRKTFRNKIDNEDDGERGWRNKIVQVTRIPKEVKNEN